MKLFFFRLMFFTCAIFWPFSELNIFFKILPPKITEFVTMRGDVFPDRVLVNSGRPIVAAQGTVVPIQ